MANRSKIKLKIPVRNGDGKYIFCAPVFAASGQMRPLLASISGNQETHPEGTYYLRYTDDLGKRVYEPVGKNANAAVKIMRSRQLARASGKVGLQVVDPGSMHMHIDDAVAVYLARVAISPSQRTQNEFNLLLPQFRTLCRKIRLDQISADDLLFYAAWLREQNLAPRTVANRVARIACFLWYYKIIGLLRHTRNPAASSASQSVPS